MKDFRACTKKELSKFIADCKKTRSFGMLYDEAVLEMKTRFK
jgi:hypothetical protein